MIKATQLTKKFGKLIALNEVNVTCQQGQCVSLIGPNGSGKTTFIKCLLGMVKPDHGFITYQKNNILHDWKYRERIGYMPQIGRYPENMTIAQVFSMIRDIRKRWNRKTDEDLVSAFGLGPLMGKRMRTLSGGTRQKVSAALAFLFSPDVLILDEPTAGLDPLASEILKEKILLEKNAGKLILITSHVLSDLDELVTEVVYLQDGRLLFHKSIAQLHADTGENRLSKAIANVMRGN